MNSLSCYPAMPAGITVYADDGVAQCAPTSSPVSLKDLAHLQFMHLVHASSGTFISPVILLEK
jgi:hypothetical protein